MINGKKVIGIIPARGGSKTIPYKNIKLFVGKPLISWTIEAAKAILEIDRIFVSTDDAKIADIAQSFGAEIMKRPADLAKDDSLPIDVIKHIIAELKSNNENITYLVYLEPTCPLREPADISNALNMLADENAGFKSVATFTEAALNPHRAWEIEQGIPRVFLPYANPWSPRQKLPKAYQLNGAVYAFSVDSITNDSKNFFNGKVGAVIMPKERSIDIDDELDFYIAESIMKRRIPDG